MSTLRGPLHDPAHLPDQILALAAGRHPGVDDAPAVVFGRDHHIVASIGKPFDIELGGSLPVRRGRDVVALSNP